MAGVKFELTHACNLRCDFCYTDSPRHTLARTADPEDDVWLALVEEAIALGIIEAVVTGGEPLLRKSLSLEMLKRLAAAGVGTVLNTNGWFIDEATADRLAAIPGLLTQVSVDGATAQLHDGARGVPGSWTRAVRALGLLLDRGAGVATVTVVTPRNAAWLEPLLVNVGLLGVPMIRVVTVGEVGAAARHRGWRVDRATIEQAVVRARAELGSTVRIQVHSDNVNLRDPERAMQRSLLVRPNGHVLLDSQRPFSFGDARDGLGAAWAAVQRHGDSTVIHEYARQVLAGRGEAPIPYLDDELPIQPAPTRLRATNAHAILARLPSRSESSRTPANNPTDLQAARDHVLDLALRRRYRAASLRWAGDPQDRRLVRLTGCGRVIELNQTAGTVLDCLSDGAPSAAAAVLACSFPDVDSTRLCLHALTITRWLVSRGVVRAGDASGHPAAADEMSELVSGGLP